MARKVRAAFDPKAFFSTVDHGRTLSSVVRNAVIFGHAPWSGVGAVSK